LSTRRQRENLMLHVLKADGTKPFAALRTKHIQDGIERRSKTPSAARNFLDTMKGLFRWARKRDHVKADPTAIDIEPPKRKKGNGFPAWMREDIETYRRKWPLGTRQRVWLDVILYTGLRRGDLNRIGKQHVRNGVATIRTEKGGETVTVTLPIIPALQATLDHGPIGDLAWICGARGEPFTKESFGNEFSQAARQAGIRKSAHGVRKIAATIAAENGATGKELDALFGWVDGGKTSAIYTAAADRARLSSQAIGKLHESGT
jgi:integrase